MDSKHTFKSSTGHLFLIRCPDCDKENYSMAVSEGICAWCGYDANKEELKHDNKNK